MTYFVAGAELEAGVEGTELVHGARVDFFAEYDAPNFAIFVR